MAAVGLKAIRDMDPRWSRAWMSVDPHLRAWLEQTGLRGPSIWAGLPSDDLGQLVVEIGWIFEEGRMAEQVVTLVGLQTAARATAIAHQQRFLGISDTQASYDAQGAA